MGYEKILTPKVDDRVSILTNQREIYAVLAVHRKPKTVDLVLLPHREFIEKGIPWGSLVYMDEEETNQAAARIVRETTDQD